MEPGAQHVDWRGPGAGPSEPGCKGHGLQTEQGGHAGIGGTGGLLSRSVPDHYSRKEAESRLCIRAVNPAITGGASPFTYKSKSSLSGIVRECKHLEVPASQLSDHRAGRMCPRVPSWTNKAEVQWSSVSSPCWRRDEGNDRGFS